MTHNMNPFDFVPFPAEKPVTKTVAEWQKSDKLLTGWIEAKITALTPVHIVGKQEADGSGCKIIRSHFYQRHGQAYIPASSIRGMLRAFIEASCNGWASQLTPYFKKESGKSGKRQIGFQAIDSRETLKNELNKIDADFQEKFALPDGFTMPQSMTDAEADNVKVDLASFLFGYIPPKGDGFHGRINIEDAPISSANLSFNDVHRIPDIQSDAFMGGGKPSASSWWYQKPYQIRLRGEVVDFVGSGYRGRKFYYHQDPQVCVQWYSDPNNWPVDDRRRLYFVPLECLPPGKATDPFRIYFEDLPEPFLNMLLFAISPGSHLCHKLGYGKPYGYGSIKIEISNGQFRSVGCTDKTPLLTNKLLGGIYSALRDREKLNAIGLMQYFHWHSLAVFVKILWYDNKSALVFSYPPFNKKYPGFLPGINKGDLQAVLSTQQNTLLKENKILPMTESEAREIASKLTNKCKRPALHFEIYQELAKGYDVVQGRKLQFA